MTSWKSTVSSVLTATLSLTAAALAPPFNTYIPAKYTIIVLAAQAVAKIIMGVLTKDADKLTEPELAKQTNTANAVQVTK